MDTAKKRYEDLTGRRFGMLQVLKKVPGKKVAKGPIYAEWLCQCDCGRTITVSSKHLKRNITTNCGCILKKTAGNGTIAENLTGQTFGYLTVLHRDQNKNGRTCWVCRCACGKLHSATAHDLKSGHTGSCGCGINRNPHSVNLSGMRFGHLLAVRSLEQRDSKGSVMWECICDCGNVTNISADSLCFHNTQSCGCKKKEWQKNINMTLHRISGTTIELLGAKKARSDNGTHVVGVQRRGDHYRAHITLCGTKYNLGTYKTMEEAKKARERGEQQLYQPVREAFRQWTIYAEENPEWAEQHPLFFAVDELDINRFQVQFYNLPEKQQEYICRLGEKRNASEFQSILPAV